MLNIIKNKQGFTFIELVFIVALISIISAVAMSDASRTTRELTMKRTTSYLIDSKEKINTFKEKNGKYPESIIEFTNIKGEFITKDAWGKEFTYNPQNGEICSSGPDTTVGTKDDICK